MPVDIYETDRHIGQLNDLLSSCPCGEKATGQGHFSYPLDKGIIVAGFRDRIQSFRRVKASLLRSNPRNWREHPVEQKQALQAILDEIGFAGAVLAREDDDGDLVLIDGHLRQDLAGDQEVPVLVLDVTEDEANKILLTYDPISSLAESNQERLEALLHEVQTSNQDLADFLTTLAEENNILPLAGDEGSPEVGDSDSELDPLPPSPGEPQDTGVFQLNPHAFFASKNEWDIPDLLPDKMAGLEHVPTETWVHPTIPQDPAKTLFLWGTNKFPEGHTEGGLVGFYVDDVRFESIWNNPVDSTYAIHENKFGAAIMPDFSLDWDWPLAMQIWQIYRARWMSRYWQEAGIKIVPNLSFGNDRTLPWLFAGIPKGSPLVAVQTRTLRGQDTNENRRFMVDRITRAVEQIEPQGVLLYGGTQHRDWLEKKLPTNVEYFWVDSWTLVRDRLRFNRSK